MTLAWLEELEMDPAKPAVAMGTRALGNRPWLVADQFANDELALKRRLCTQRHADVFAALPQALQPSLETAQRLSSAGVPVDGLSNLHPLDAAGRSVQEDLCLMERRANGWHLSAASLCFPSRWRLSDKLNQHMARMHAPVVDYQAQLEQRVDVLFDRLRQPVWRRNWFVHGDPTLFQPVRPDTEPVVPKGRCREGLVVRSERQVLIRLDTPNWILFSIKTQQAPLGALLDHPTLGPAFATYLTKAHPAAVAHHGINEEQQSQILAAIGPVRRVTQTGETG